MEQRGMRTNWHSRRLTARDQKLLARELTLGEVVYYELDPEYHSSYIALDSLALEVATGQLALGNSGVAEPLHVLFINLEDPVRRHGKRVQRLSAGMGLEIPFGLYRWNSATFCLDNPRDMEHLRLFVREKRIKLVIISPLVFAHNKNDNNADEMEEMLAPVKKLAAQTGSCILIANY